MPLGNFEQIVADPLLIKSRPEAEKLLLTIGKRDVSYDDMPVALYWCRPGDLRTRTVSEGHVVTGLNDQHCHMSVPPDSPLQVGDMVELMGPTVLESGVPIREGLHLYAHCLRGTPGGVALLAINNSRTQPTSIVLPNGGDRYTMSAPDLEATQVQLNGEVRKQSAGDEFPALKPIHVLAGTIELQPASISFLAVLKADNPSCR